MAKHCVSVHFCVRKSRKDKFGLSPVECFVGVNGERVI